MKIQVACICICDSYIVYQREEFDPESKEEINSLKEQLQNISNKENKPVRYCFKDGSIFEFQPHSQRQ